VDPGKCGATRETDRDGPYDGNEMVCVCVCVCVCACVCARVRAHARAQRDGCGNMNHVVGIVLVIFMKVRMTSYMRGSG